MELTLNYSPMGDPMDGQDIKWLQYVWECSDGKEVTGNGNVQNCGKISVNNKGDNQGIISGVNTGEIRK